MTNLPHINDYFLNIKYTGDVAMAFIENDLVLDHFWHGKPWCISMKRFTERLKQSKEMNFYFRPLAKDAPFIEMGGIPQEFIPDFSQEDHILEISNVELIPEYRIDIDE